MRRLRDGFETLESRTPPASLLGALADFFGQSDDDLLADLQRSISASNNERGSTTADHARPPEISKVEVEPIGSSADDTSIVSSSKVGKEPVLAAKAARAPQDMKLVITEENAGLCGHDFSRASATMQIKEKNDGTTQVTLQVRGAVPNSIYTMWLRINAPGSPLFGGAGATPAAGTGDLQTIIDNADTESAAGANAFYTNAAGNGTLHVTLDFHLSDGVYPFSEFDDSVDDGTIGDTPFTFRVISHCTDGLQHGLNFGPHEATFDYPA